MSYHPDRADRFMLHSTGRTVTVTHPISARQMQSLSSSEREDVLRHCQSLLYSGQVTSSQIAVLQATIDNVYSANEAQARTSSRHMTFDNRTGDLVTRSSRNVRFADELDDDYRPAAPMPPSRSALSSRQSYSGYHAPPLRSSDWRDDYRSAQEYMYAQGGRPRRATVGGYHYGMDERNSRPRGHRSGRREQDHYHYGMDEHGSRPRGHRSGRHGQDNYYHGYGYY